MKNLAIGLVFILAACLTSCASTANYPIALSYEAQGQVEKTGGATITVARLVDKRPVADKRVIGEKEGDADFVSLLAAPAQAVSTGLADYLKARGYTADTINKEWACDAESLNPGWGDTAIGGTLDELALNVKGNLVKTEYDCSVKFTLCIAAPKSEKMLHKEKFEVTSSYVTVSFSREKAEELIDKALSEAIERGLADIGKYANGAGNRQ